MKFLDQAKIFIRSGNGGNGCLSFRREKYIEYGGPDGGNGGWGGDILVTVDPNLNTLIDFRYTQHFKARSGQSGGGGSRAGKAGPSKTLRVPPGTQIWDETRTVLLYDMLHPAQTEVLLKGGRGGRGNESFKSSTNRTPRQTTKGELGQEMWIWLQLKLIADIGLLGLPNAGKSTFLKATSGAKPKIGDYPFTTLHPQLGTLQLDSDDICTLADLPGLIAGAHEGRGLGDRFLKHLERCKAFIHLIDATAPNVIEAYDTILKEVEAYGGNLLQKPHLLALSKTDLIQVKDLNTKRDELEKHTGKPIHLISSHTGKGIAELLQHIFQEIRHIKADMSNT
jgi:GTP-binding protein